MPRGAGYKNLPFLSGAGNVQHRTLRLPVRNHRGLLRRLPAPACVFLVTLFQLARMLM